MIIRHLGLQPYFEVWQDMKNFTLNRQEETQDECWLLEHLPVYTQGQAGKNEHILNPGNIPIVQSDRGGQVTYHGPGQLVLYTLINLTKRNLGIRTLVSDLQQLIILLLANYNIPATTLCEAPGVYVDNKKIASIGLRVKNGCTYHGLALNVGMDLTPFKGINPCGFSQLQMIQMKDFIANISLQEVAQQAQSIFLQRFS